MRYRFTDTWASVVVGAGWIVFIGSVFAGIAHGLAREAGIVGAHPFTRFNARVEERRPERDSRDEGRWAERSAL